MRAFSRGAAWLIVRLRWPIVLAWLLARSPAMLPIPGTGSAAHLEENVSAASIELTADEVAALSTAE